MHTKKKFTLNSINTRFNYVSATEQTVSDTMLHPVRLGVHGFQHMRGDGLTPVQEHIDRCAVMQYFYRHTCVCFF